MAPRTNKKRFVAERVAHVVPDPECGDGERQGGEHPHDPGNDAF